MVRVTQSNMWQLTKILTIQMVQDPDKKDNMAEQISAVKEFHRRSGIPVGLPLNFSPVSGGGGGGGGSQDWSAPVI